MNRNEKATAALSMQQSELKTELGSLTRTFRADRNNYLQPLTRMETIPPSTPLCPGIQMHPQAEKFLQAMKTEIYSKGQSRVPHSENWNNQGHKPVGGRIVHTEAQIHRAASDDETASPQDVEHHNT